MKRYLPYLPVLLFAFTLVACDSSDPNEGNAGVVSFSFDFNVNSASQNGTVLSQQFDVPEITPNVVDFGAVLVYFEEQGTWTAMPYTYGVESATEPLVDYTVTLGYAYDTRLLEVFYETSADPDAIELPGGVRMKAVIIESLPVGKNAIDLRDYEAVKQYYGLED